MEALMNADLSVGKLPSYRSVPALRKPMTFLSFSSSLPAYEKKATVARGVVHTAEDLAHVEEDEEGRPLVLLYAFS